MASSAKWTGRVAAIAVGLLAAAPGVWAQGCAMCYANAAAQGPKAKRWLDYAILVLLIPAVTMFAGVLFALRRRDREMAGAELADPGGKVSPRVPANDSRARFASGASPASL
ncbi:MAG TPA: hypothetical protein VKG84_08440 [Candidatus Acidoferrales bacterium]|nr:hypothetical protein [Candidatus Acidoferrales bacterium]